jgi:Phosphodiester glycosidase
MRLAPRLAILSLSLFAAEGAARAEVTKPAPGLTLVRHGGRALVVADLCAAGVSVRATKYAERKKTPQGWAESIDAEVAVNADFFDFPGATQVNGRARGAGEDWPADKQFVEYTGLGEVRHYWQFGPGLAALVSPSTSAPSAGATEMVGAHNRIISGGQSLAPDFDGDGVILGSYRRTGIGLDAARAHLYLFASNDTLSGTQMAATMIAYAAEAGAPPIDAASNEDGGGSSQMYVKGQGQIVTSGRLVANHLGVFAKGAGPSPMCPNKAPRGYLDAATCEALTGWAQDADAPKKAIDVHFYFDGPAGTPGARAFALGGASVHRADLCTAIGSCEHGFSVPTPFGLFDGKEHAVHAYAIDSNGGANPELAQAPKKVTCNADLPRGTKRRVAGDAFAAWKLDAFRDVMRVTDAMLAPLGEGAALPATPVMIRADDGSHEVWLVDGAMRRHVLSPASAAAWHLDLGAVTVKPAAEVNAIARGADLPVRPLVASVGADRWLLDVPDPADPDSASKPVGAGPPRGSARSDDAAAMSDDTGGCRTAPGSHDLGGVAIALGFACLVRGKRRRRT